MLTSTELFVLNPVLTQEPSVIMQIINILICMIINKKKTIHFRPLFKKRCDISDIKYVLQASDFQSGSSRTEPSFDSTTASSTSQEEQLNNGNGIAEAL